MYHYITERVHKVFLPPTNFNNNFRMEVCVYTERLTMSVSSNGEQKPKSFITLLCCNSISNTTDSNL